MRARIVFREREPRRRETRRRDAEKIQFSAPLLLVSLCEQGYLSLPSGVSMREAVSRPFSNRAMSTRLSLRGKM